MKKIKTKKDAQYFIEHFGSEYSEYEGGEEDISRFIIYDDPSISMSNGGHTSILRCWNAAKKINEWYIFSEGPGWCDQERTLIGNDNDAINFVWKNRRGINASISVILKYS